MTTYWSTCAGCTFCTTDGCSEVAYCDKEAHHGPAHCDTHMPRAAS